MKKTELLFFAFLTLIIFVSCVPKKDYEKLQEENKSLQKEIEILKQTDEYYYKEAVDKYQRKEFENALNELEELSLKFPQSTLKEDINNLISQIKSEEKAYKNEILTKSKKADSLDESISICKQYLSENHLKEFNEEIQTQLSKYIEKYEKNGYLTLDFSTYHGLYEGNNERIGSKICLQNLKVDHVFDHNRISLADKDGFLNVYCKDDNMLKEFIKLKDRYVNIYGITTEFDFDRPAYFHLDYYEVVK